ncbi:HNH endonuclease signature motif containing protein [Pseudonocardia halophobica]|uniref:HNH endonuclease signature motif containing protein n=2 Tax=Pseudonocardia halophobica TaxID=29401 RepID=UPI0031E2722C
MQQAELIQDLADLPPGPALAAALAAIDPITLPLPDRLTVVEAWHRQHSHSRAGFYRALVALGTDDPTQPGWSERDWSDEVRAALAWTRRAADARADDAVTLVVDLPLVWAALDAGRIDPPKAAVFAQHLTGLPAAQIAHLCRLVLPRAPRWTTTEISRRLRRLIMEIDPAHYERLFRRAHARRGISACVTEDGTATITATGLAPDSADAAVERIGRLAHRVKRAGHGGGLDQIRVDLFVGFLDGSLHTLTDDQITAALLASQASRPAEHATRRRSGRPGLLRTRACREDTSGSSGMPRTDKPEAGNDGRLHTPSLSAEQGSPAGGGGEASAGEPGVRCAAASGPPAGSWPSSASPEPTPPTESTTPGEPSGSPGSSSRPTEPSGPHGPANGLSGPDQPVVRRRGVHLQISLATLLGLDDRPAELPTLGPIPASRARDLIRAQHRAPWRFALTDTDGRLLRAGTLRRRPTAEDLPPPPPSETSPGAASPVPPTDPAAPGLVDLLVDAALLRNLTTDPTAVPPSWRPVLDEITNSHGRPLDDAPTDRFPHAALRRHVEFRDRICTFTGCLAPAHHTDLDHTRDHAHGGPTTADDLGPACRHDHGLKQRGWTLTQPEPGIFVWRSPLGREYRTRSDPLLPPPPPPLPVAEDDDPCCADPLDDLDRSGPLIVWRPATDDHDDEPRPPPHPATDLDEPPPF